MVRRVVVLGVSLNVVHRVPVQDTITPAVVEPVQRDDINLVLRTDLVLDPVVFVVLGDTPRLVVDIVQLAEQEPTVDEDGRIVSCVMQALTRELAGLRVSIVEEVDRVVIVLLLVSLAKLERIILIPRAIVVIVLLVAILEEDGDIVIAVLLVRQLTVLVLDVLIADQERIL
jgi:hypothetical protein